MFLVLLLVVFRIYRHPIIRRVEKAVVITKAVVALHNFLIPLSTIENNCSYCHICVLVDSYKIKLVYGVHVI